MKRALPILLFAMLLVPLATPMADAGLGGKGAGKDDWKRQFYASTSPLPTHAIVTVHYGGEVRQMPLAAAAEMYAEDRRATAEAMSQVADVAMVQGGYRDRGEGRANAQPWTGHAGLFRITETLINHGGAPDGLGCSDLGEQRHAFVWLDNPAPVDGVLHRYLGASYSEVAARGGSGSIHDLVTGEAHSHFSTPIYYSGSSDFFCVEGRIGSIWVMLHEPTVTGVVFGVDPQL